MSNTYMKGGKLIMDEQSINILKDIAEQMYEINKTLKYGIALREEESKVIKSRMEDMSSELRGIKQKIDKN